MADLEIKPRVYFSDEKISQKTIVDNYKKYLSNSKYSNASTEINKLLKYTNDYLTDVAFLGATLLNDIENRMLLVEEYLEDAGIEKPELTLYGEQPVLSVGMHWISDSGLDYEVIVSGDSTSEYVNEDETSSTIGLIE